jgi:alpha-N-acetylglucosaminidase
MQGWMFGYQRDIWDAQSVEALLSGAPDDKMMIIDLAVDFNNYVWKNGNSWDNLNGFFNKPWIWSTVPNFGGRTALKGPLDFYLNGHLEAVRSENKGHLTGFGTSPEGVENNEVIYELISAAAWSCEEIDLEGFLDAYNKARYGEANPAFTEFWKELRKTVYNNFTNNARFLWQQRPAYHRGETMNINEHYFTGIESFLSVADKYKDNELYVTDAIQYAALYLAAKADYALKAANWAIVAGDTKKAEELVATLCNMLLEMDKLLESHPILRIQRWMDMAAERATSPEETAAFQKEIMRLVSTWSGPSLKDYSARVWSGLIRDFYMPRMEYYYSNALKGEVADLVKFESDYHYGVNYGTAEDVCPADQSPVSTVEPYENPLDAAVALVKKYSDIRYDDKNFNPYAPENEVTYWCPQDFAGKSKKRLYMTIMATDFAKMNGIKITNARGENVKISKVEFKSGPEWFGRLNLNEKIRSPRQVVKIPFKGPGTTAGMEREVVIYVTIEGGPQSWGMISLY